MIQKTILTVLSIVLLLSCSDNSNNNIYQYSHLIDVELVDVPVNVNQIQNHVKTYQQHHFLSYFNPENNTMGIYDMDNQRHKTISIPMQKLIKKRRTSSDLFVYSLDSIFYFDRDLNGVFLFDTSCCVINKYPINSKYPAYGAPSNFYVFSKYLYYSWFPKVDIGEKSIRKELFSKLAPICKKELGNENAYIFGSTPDKYKTGNNYYSYGPDIFVGLQNQIIISYPPDHNIYIYNNEKLTKRACKSNFIECFTEISDEQFRNISFCRTYMGQEPKYTKIVANPYRAEYYRIAKLRFDLENVDIKSARWSIIIMNERFEVTGEVVLPYSEFMPDIIVPAKEGLYVKKTPKRKEEFSGNLTLSLLQFTL